MKLAIPIATMMRQRLPLRVAAIWIALATALLCSLMPDGLPRSTAYGSAFNPATTAVALKPTRDQIRVLVTAGRHADDPPGGQGGSIAIVPLSDLPLLTPQISGAALRFAGRVLSLPAHPVIDGNPRAPPRF